MTDNRTTELREKLTERGVKYEVNRLDFDDGNFNIYTEWGDDDNGKSYVEYADGTVLRIFGCTPDQAIAATLGDDDYECRMDELLCRLTNGKWSKSRSYSVDFMVSCVDEAYEDAALGEKRTCETCDELGNADSFITHLVNAERREISGTLTAEQVSEIVEKHTEAENVGWNGVVAMNYLPDWQAIADELNATLGSEAKSMRIFANMETALTIADKEVEIEELRRENAELCKENEELTHRRAELEAATLGSRTCRDIWDIELTGRLRFECSECRAVSLEITPNYCPNCGAKVVS